MLLSLLVACCLAHLTWSEAAVYAHPSMRIVRVTWIEGEDEDIFIKKVNAQMRIAAQEHQKTGRTTFILARTVEDPMNRRMRSPEGFGKPHPFVRSLVREVPDEADRPDLINPPRFNVHLLNLQKAWEAAGPVTYGLAQPRQSALAPVD